jgi:hypothetical protein
MDGRLRGRISVAQSQLASGSFFTTKAGAPYLARFWPDMGIHCFQPEDFQTHRHSRAIIREFPHLAKTGPDMGHPLAFLKQSLEPRPFAIV